MALYSIKNTEVLVDKSNYTTIQVTKDNVKNGLLLKNAYAKAVGLQKEYTIFLPPGTYDLNGTNLDLISDFIKIIGLSSNKNDVLIKSSFADNKKGVINQLCKVIHLENLSVQNTFFIDNPSANPEIEQNENPESQVVFLNNPKFRSGFSNNFCPIFKTISPDDLYQKEIDDDFGVTFKKVINSNQIEVFRRDFLDEIEGPQVGVDVPLPDTEYKVWKLIRREKNQQGIFVDTDILAIEKPILLSQTNFPVYTSISHILQPWPWLVQEWEVFAEASLEIGYIAPSSYIENVNFKNDLHSLSMASHTFYGGTFKDVEAKTCSFGGVGGYLEGIFDNCQGEDYSFVACLYLTNSLALNNIKMNNCTARFFSFGSRGLIQGDFKNIKAGSDGESISICRIGKPIGNSILQNIEVQGVAENE